MYAIIDRSEEQRKLAVNQSNTLSELSKKIGKYIPPQIHEGILEGKYDTNITTKRKKLTIFFSDIKNFTDTSEKLQPEDWAGNTFTISNLGMFGIDEFTAIVNPPDSCILAVGGIQQVPVVKNGQVVPGNVMKVTLSCDHRVVDGAVGSAFLNSFKNYLENPVLLLGKDSI